MCYCFILQEQVLQQTQLQEQQDQQQQIEEEQQQVTETQTIPPQQQEQPSPQPSAPAVTQATPFPIAITTQPTNTQSLPTILPTSLPTTLDGLNPQILQQNMQTLLSEIASQITQQQQNMQQLLIEMQNELTAQQIQQLSNLATANSNPTPATNINNTITSQPPPSYPVAVALNAVNASQGQQVQTTSSTSGGVNPSVTSSNQQGPHVIIQAIPTLQQNVLLGNATLTSQLLNAGTSETPEQTQQDAPAVSAATNIQLQAQTYPQQILVSLAPTLNQDTLTTSTLGQNSLTQDPTEVVEIQFQDVPPNQEVHQDRANQERQSSNELPDALAQQIRLAGLNFGNQELRAALGGTTLPSISQGQTFTTTTRNRSVRVPTLDTSGDLTTDSTTRQTISLLHQGTDAAGGTVTTNPQLPVETLLSPEALQIFGSTVNQNLILQPILSSSISKQNTVQTSQ